MLRLIVPHLLWIQAIIFFAPFSSPLCANKSDQKELEYPNRPIKLIIPFSVGGGSDTFARILAKAIKDKNLLPQPIVIINVNGASGTIGSRRVKNARPDGYTLMMLHDAIFTAKYSGLAPYGPEAFSPVAATGEIDLLLTATNDSPFQTLADVAEAAAENPNELVFGTAIGTPTHMMGLLTEKAHGSAKFRFTQAGSGAQRISALTGGHIDLSPFSVEEFLRYQPTGIKALAVFSDQRLPQIPEVPTALELGIDATLAIRNFWWFPKGTPPERIRVIATALEQAMQTEYVRSKLAVAATKPSTLRDAALSAEIARKTNSMSAVTLVKTDAVPKFELWTLFIASALLSAFFIRKRSAKSPPTPEAKKSVSYSPPKAWAAFCLTLLYTTIIAVRILNYPVATTLYTLALCLVVGGFKLRILTRALPFSLTMGYGLFYLFTKILTIDLPG